MDFFNKNKKELIKLGIYIVIVLLIILIINKFLFSLVRVSGDSMNPALADRDVIVVDKTMDKEDFERFDIVAFKYMYDNKDMYLKRIIGLPGEIIEIIDNKIYIDGEVLTEFYGAFNDGESIYDVTVNFSNYPKTKLDVDEYFVLGDNRYVSDDSRNFGPITGDLIVGKAVFRIWDFNGIGSLKYQ